MEMRRSNRLAQMQAKPESDAQMEPKLKKRRPDSRTPNIATLDNGTMVDTFQYLNYMQLAKSSLISKRFFNLIRTHRHSLTLLYVDRISINGQIGHAAFVQIFNNVLSLKKCDQWAIRNNYSKQIPSEGQVSKKKKKQNGRQLYEMNAYYKDFNTNRSTSVQGTSVLHARVELNHEYWPLFQHFVRLLTAPFTYICHVQLTPRIDVCFLNLLAGAMNSGYNRLQCNTLMIYSSRTNRESNIHKFIGWIKNHVRCNKCDIYEDGNSNFDEELLDYLSTGANCTSKINVDFYDLSKVVVDMVQKFLDLQNYDENKMIETIGSRGIEARGILKVLKRKCSTFIVRKRNDSDLKDELDKSLSTEQVFEFVNNRIGKKLQLTVIVDFSRRFSNISLKISNL